MPIILKNKVLLLLQVFFQIPGVETDWNNRDSPRSCAVSISNKREPTHRPAAHTLACSASIHLDIVFMMCAKHEAVLRQVCQDVCGSIWPWLKDAIPLVSMCAGTCVHVEAGGQARISVLRCHLPRLEKQSLSLAWRRLVRLGQLSGEAQGSAWSFSAELGLQASGTTLSIFV